MTIETEIREYVASIWGCDGVIVGFVLSIDGRRGGRRAEWRRLAERIRHGFSRASVNLIRGANCVM